MRLRLSLSCLVMACAAQGVFAQPAASGCADLHLVPAPRECKAVEKVPATALSVHLTSEDAEDRFTEKDLKGALEVAGVKLSAEGTPIVLERAQSEQAKELLRKHEITFDSALHDEGYVLVPDGRKGLAVIAESSAGLFYGAQTVKQLVRGSGKDAELLVPTVRDWPAMPHRGLSDDWSRGPRQSVGA